ncbi:MAG TPA: DedA family protein [Rugosimonospora sp.]|nr:DedA family protein [Rugosimonospora sp.]
MGAITDWLGTLPPLLLYLMVALIIGTESMGIPLPGEIALVTASLLAASGHADVWWVGVAGSAGAVVGDSVGYAIGRRGGRGLLERLGRRFPDHLGETQLRSAERAFDRWGVWAIFFGRFVALLRILAGPLAGALRVPYPKFLVANASGGIAWAGGTTAAIYFAGKAAEAWLQNFAWVALLVAVLFGIATTLVLRARARRRTGAPHAQPEDEGVEVH